MARSEHTLTKASPLTVLHPQTTAVTTGSWEDHSAHPSMNNPQYLIKLPIISQAGSRFADATGKHQLEIRAERTDGGGETMNLTLYKSITGKQFLEPPEASLKLAESSNTADRKTATCSATVVGGSYIACLSLDQDQAHGTFKLTVSTDAHEPRVSALTKQVVEVDAAWDPATGRCGGYGKAENPQFVLTLPAGEHEVTIKPNPSLDTYLNPNRR